MLKMNILSTTGIQPGMLKTFFCITAALSNHTILNGPVKTGAAANLGDKGDLADFSRTGQKFSEQTGKAVQEKLRFSMANRAGVWYTLTWIILQKHPRLGKEKHTMMEKNTPRRPRRSPEEAPAKNESLVYGKNPVAELLKSGSGVDTVLLAEGMAPAVAAYYTALAKEAGAAVKRVHPNKLRLMTGTESHQGVAAFASEIEYVAVEDLLQIAKEKGEPPFLVLCDGLEDPHNLGAVMRSALLCGAHGIVIPRRGGAQVTPTVLKSSAGAAERLPVARVANIGETIRRLKEQGVFVYCADMDGVSLHKSDLTGPIALVMGSEGSGVSQLVKKLCDGVVRLDMAAEGTGVDSFNVSVAAGIILYEIRTQRAAKL
jgi:23S rRNA (guanosine2251-2'-O)-methyltransferase